MKTKTTKMTTTNAFAGWTLSQLRERARLNGERGIRVSAELRAEITKREAATYHQSFDRKGNDVVMSVPANHDEDGRNWIVMCRVSGGVTGTREAVLKANDVVQYFDEAGARAKAQQLMAKMNNQYSVANFQYWPVRADDTTSRF